MAQDPGTPGTRGLSLRAQQKLFTRERLIAAATELFDSRGYVDTTVDDIAQRAGSSRATFYLHFSGKAEVVDELWATTRVGVVDLFKELGTEVELTREWLGEWLGRTFDFYTGNRAHLLAIHQAIAVEAALADRFNARIDEVETSLTQRIRAARQVDEDEAHLRASLLVMQHERFCHFWLLREIPFDRELATRVLRELWWSEVGDR
ncbi:MAG: TetR family transcriptional regulator [Marmoricola sp.]|nr:TetR family transcriptional regulator [Marmoricola sp.]